MMGNAWVATSPTTQGMAVGAASASAAELDAAERSQLGLTVGACERFAADAPGSPKR